MEHIYDMIIIGGGPAGYTAALYASRAGLDALVIESMAAGGQMAITDVIDNYPGFDEGIDGFTLGMRMQTGAQRFGAKTKYATVNEARLSGDIKKIYCGDEEINTRTVVIATGAQPRPLGLSDEDTFSGRGVHYCAHCDGRFYKDKTVAVVGGGNTAVSDALYLSRLAKKVYVIHRRDTLRATKIYHDPLMKAQNVEFIWNTHVTELMGDNRLSAIGIERTDNGEKSKLYIDGLFVSIGREPSTQLFGQELLLDKNGYIVADESTKTNVCGVYAVGDVRTKALRQIVTAVADGAVAAHFAEEYLSGYQN